MAQGADEELIKMLMMPMGRNVCFMNDLRCSESGDVSFAKGVMSLVQVSSFGPSKYEVEWLKHGMDAADFYCVTQRPRN